MADLLKYRARKPILENAGAIGSQTYSKDRVAYRIDLIKREGRDYHVVFTREEMLEIVASWIAGEARSASEAAKKARAALTVDY